MTTEVENEMMHLQVKELQEFLTNTRSWQRQGRIFLYRLEQEYSPEDILIFGLLVSRIVRQ